MRSAPVDFLVQLIVRSPSADSSICDSSVQSMRAAPVWPLSPVSL